METLTSAQLATIVGIKFDRLQKLMQRNALGCERIGARGRRRFTFEDACLLRVATTLKNFDGSFGGPQIAAVMAALDPARPEFSKEIGDCLSPPPQKADRWVAVCSFNLQSMTHVVVADRAAIMGQIQSLELEHAGSGSKLETIMLANASEAIRYVLAKFTGAQKH